MHFGGVVAVDRVDFSLRENELRCLIGPNGAGKSTFFKCLTAQLRPTAGDVVIRDFNVTGSESHQVARMGVGIKTQVPNLFDGLPETRPARELWVESALPSEPESRRTPNELDFQLRTQLTQSVARQPRMTPRRLAPDSKEDDWLLQAQRFARAAKSERSGGPLRP